MAKRKSNYMRLSSADAARSEHGVRRERAMSAAAFRRSIKGMPAAAQRLARKARKSAMAESQKAHRTQMRELDREIRGIKSKSRGTKLGPESTRVRIGKGKKSKKSKSRGPVASLRKLGKSFFSAPAKLFGWGASSAGKRFKSGQHAGKKGKKLKLKGGKKKTNPSLHMIPGYDLVMSGPFGEALSYVPGATLGVASAVVLPRFLPSWNVGWWGIGLRLLTVGLVSTGVASVASRKHGVATAIGGLIATVIEGVNMLLSPESQVRSAFDMSGLADSVSFADAEALSSEVVEDDIGQLDEGSGFSGELDEIGGSVDPVFELEQAIGASSDMSDLDW